MSDLKNYIKQRKKVDPKFAKNYDIGYQDFKIGEMLKQARIERLSTLQNFAQVMGRELKMQLA